MGSEQRHCDRTSDAIRQECYDGLRACMMRELHAYYAMHPEWLLDERSQYKLEMMHRVLSEMYRFLDDFDICRR